MSVVVFDFECVCDGDCVCLCVVGYLCDGVGHGYCYGYVCVYAMFM